MSDIEDKKLLSVLSGEEALVVLNVLVDRDPVLAAVVLQEVKEVLNRPSVIKEVSDKVYRAIYSLQIEDCWNRSGGQMGGGYNEPSEVAHEMVEEVIDRFLLQLKKYRATSSFDLEVEYLKGIMLGLYKADHDTTMDLSELLDDSCYIHASNLIYDWKELHKGGDEYTTSLMKFISESCPDWDTFAEDLYWLGVK